MTFECLKCGRCCRAISLPNHTIKKHLDQVQRPIVQMIPMGKYESVPLTRDGVCPFLKDDLCIIYADRPDICRNYGVVDYMPCNNGDV